MTISIVDEKVDHGKCENWMRHISPLTKINYRLIIIWRVHQDSNEISREYNWKRGNRLHFEIGNALSIGDENFFNEN